MRHHPWCNWQNPMRPEDGAEGCEFCAGLHKDHPLRPGDTPEDLRKRYFPNVKVVRE